MAAGAEVLWMYAVLISIKTYFERLLKNLNVLTAVVDATFTGELSSTDPAKTFKVLDVILHHHKGNDVMFRWNKRSL